MKQKTNISISKAISSILKEQINIPLFAVIADSDTKGNYIVFKRDSLSRAETKDLYTDTITVYITFSVVAVNYADSVQIAQNIINVLEHFRGVVSDFDIEDITVENAAEGWSDDYFFQSLQFKIDYSQTTK